MSKVSAVIAAGGKGTRMGADKNKVFLKLCGKEIILHTIEAFDSNPDIDEIIVVAGKDEHMKIGEMASHIQKLRAVTTGGKTRQESVYNGISFTSGDIILIHDGARCLIEQEEISAVIRAAESYGAAAVGVSSKDTLKTADDNGFITGTIDRGRVFNIQTPQAFKKHIIIRAHENAVKEGFTATDDCAIVERYGGKIKIVEGKYENIKITTPDDLEIAEKVLIRRKVCKK